MLISGIVAAPRSGIGNPDNAQQFYDRVITEPPPLWVEWLNEFFGSLTSSGVFEVLDGCLITGIYDEAVALTNLCPTGIQFMFYGLAGPEPDFVKRTGYQCAPPGVKGVRALFDPSTDVGSFGRNSASMFAYILDHDRDAKLFDNDVGNNQIELWPKNGSGDTVAALNNTEFNAGNVVVSSTGFWCLNRTTANAVKVYHDDIVVYSGVDASVTPPAGNLFWTGYDGLVALGFGGAMSPSQVAALKAALVVLFTRTGVLP